MNLLRQLTAPRFLAVSLLAALPACTDTPPNGPNGFLTGSWSRSNPDGYFRLTLQAAGGIVTGTAVEVCCPSGTVIAQGTVSGTYGGGGFTLTFTYPAKTDYWMGTSATWTGHLGSCDGNDQLQGPLTVTAPVDSSLGTFGLIRDPSE